MGQNDEEPQKMFSFDDQKGNTAGGRQQLQTQQNVIYDSSHKPTGQSVEKMGHLQ